jgi:hypothetical protein
VGGGHLFPGAIETVAQIDEVALELVIVNSDSLQQGVEVELGRATLGDQLDQPFADAVAGWFSGGRPIADGAKVSEKRPAELVGSLRMIGDLPSSLRTSLPKGP